MGSVDKLDADQGILRAENIRVNSVQGVSALIVIAIAGGPCKKRFRHPVFLKGRQHLLTVVLRHRVNLGKLRCNLPLRLLRQSQHAGRKPQWIGHIHHSISSLSQNT